MNLRKILYLAIAAVLSTAIISPDFTADAAKKRSKAKTSQSSSKKKKKKSTSKKGAVSKKRSSRKGVTRKQYKYTPPAPEQPSYDSLTLVVNEALLSRIPANLNPGGLRVNNVKTDSINRIARIGLNENFTYLPITAEYIDTLRRYATGALPDSLSTYRVTLNVGKRDLAYYITKVDKLPREYRRNIPFVTPAQPLVKADKGMENDVVALWSSHGRYYKPSAGAWMWQRPLLFETVEDTYTMGYVLPFIAPMLENAGAYVMMPRERDVNFNEVIVDNDVNDEGQIFSQPYYSEVTGSKHWKTGDDEGFIYDLPDFRDTENPFENGTYRQVETVTSESARSLAAWAADIPEDGEYAVYVSYHSLPSSASDATYTVNYSGGSKEFKVNQTMGGGTWIYLGTFPLEAGFDPELPIVTLSNVSAEAGKTITADAVKIGGGMGNIARSPRRSDIFYDPSTPEQITQNVEGDDDEGDDEVDDETTDETSEDTEPAATPATETPAPAEKKGPAPVFRTSGMPRFLEGARYWLHWAGAPESIYSPYHGTDDYKDDYTSRGHWVNWLAGGSRVLPDKEGLNIPVDLVMALHSDAGKRSDDSFVGTLGIYFTNDGASYSDGTPRINSRMLTDLMMRQITSDVRQQFEPNWTRRSMWDKSYVEARVPEVPTSLIELMSHQNFADMMYGLDPAFRFTVSRAIYKGMARFMAERKDRDLVIQPLPVKDFAIERTRHGHFRLSWQPTPDPLEPTAMPKKYVIMERTGDELGFHKIAETNSTHFNVTIHDNLIHSYKIIAANDGGLAFPSEVLALRESEKDEKPVLIVNGFTRVSAPATVNSDGKAGFDSHTDFGVPYIRDISFTGYQTEFRRNAGESAGRSESNYATQVIAGNTFDYPAIHGEALAAIGRGFVSASAGAVESGEVRLSDYPLVDLILGKQKTTITGNGKSGVRYATFPTPLRQALTNYARKGGRLFVSGQYAASDILDPHYSPDARSFSSDILGIEYVDSLKSRSGRVKVSDCGKQKGIYPYSATLNDSIYIVENPDAISAAEGADAIPFVSFTDSDATAGLLISKGNCRNAVMTLPFEAILNASDRNRLMKQILDFLQQ